MKRGRGRKRSAEGVPSAKDNRESPATWWKSLQVPGICVLLAALTLFVFLQTRGFEFVNYDDDKNVYENPVVVAGLTKHGLAWAFTHSQIGHWVPLTTISHMLDCQFHGLNAGPHHVTNVMLHAASATILFLVLRSMTGALWPCAFVAAVFAIHPLRVESVAWVTERKDVLSGLFFMLTIGAYVRYARKPSSPGRYLAVFLLFALGLMSKSMLVTLPLVLLLLDYWPLQRLGRPAAVAATPESIRAPCRTPVSWRVLYEKVPLLALSIAASAVTLLANRRSIVSLEHLSLFARVSNALVSSVTYLCQMLYPGGLAVLYPLPQAGLPSWKVVGAGVLLTAISTGAIALRRRQPWLLTGWLWYLGMLVPVIGIIQSGTLARADRYTYLPQIGLYLGLTWTVAKWCESSHFRRWGTGIAAVIVVTILAICSRLQTQTWRNYESLWTQALACTSGNITAHYNFGVGLAEHGRIDEAIAHYRKALEIKPHDADTHINLGVALLDRKQIAEAIAHFRQALAVRAGDAAIHDSLGNALTMRGANDEAITHYRKALEIKPDYVGAHTNLGNALLSRGQIDEAVVHYQKALEIKPDTASTHNNLGNAMLALGENDKAITHYQNALKIEPGVADTHYNLGNALLERGRIDEAVIEFRKALSLNPEDAAAHFKLGNALMQGGDIDGGIPHYRRALEIKPGYDAARNNLNLALSEREGILKTLAERRESLRSRPNDIALLSDTAWVLATNPNASVRNGNEAVALAERAVELSAGRDPAILGTLAAAYAEAGRFDEAAKVAERALALTSTGHNHDLAGALRSQARLYQSGFPHREKRQHSSRSTKP